MRSHRAVLDWIEAELNAGRLRVGGHLPPERDLAERFGISRTSVREALRVLEALGVIRAAVGSGPRAGTTITADPASAFGASLRLHVASDQIPVADVVQSRVLLESWSCERIDASAEQLDTASELLRQMQAYCGEGVDAAEDFLKLDVLFHVELARAAGNAVVSTMMLSLREAIREYTGKIALSKPERWREIATNVQREHETIVAFLRAGKKSDAAAAVRAHIEGFYRLAEGSEDSKNPRIAKQA